ncbi:myb-related protein 308 [Senna tora]|uniref:Myb-related protein 308 n=1 Tax=Senna tora TaxID=362788 RepID=A0A834TZI4_9FABA|nr:myb-related protein 308 [Senna tora]
MKSMEELKELVEENVVVLKACLCDKSLSEATPASLSYIAYAYFSAQMYGKDLEDLGTDYLIRPVATAEDEEASSDFEPDENGEDEGEGQGEDDEKAENSKDCRCGIVGSVINGGTSSSSSGSGYDFLGLKSAVWDYRSLEMK